MTKTMKPVWRMNTGCKSQHEHLEFVLLRNGNLTNRQQSLGMADFDWSIQGLWDDIIAYQTTRTREAKYERVECTSCKWRGKFKLVSRHFGFGSFFKCAGCDGKGYTIVPIL